MAGQNTVFVGAFSKKALDQLKKTFAPSLESIFEARQQAAGVKEIKKASGGGGLLALLMKPFKRLIAVLALAAAAVIAFALILHQKKKKWKDTIDQVFSVDTAAEISGFQLMMKKWRDAFKTDPDKAKKPGMIKEAWTKWVAKYDALILRIKDSKVVTSVGERWTRMSAAVSNFFKPLTSFLFDESGTKKPEAKSPPAWTKFSKWFKDSNIGKFFGAGGWLFRKIPFLYHTYAFYESTVAGVAAIDKQDELNKAKKFGEATWFEKTKTFSKEFSETAITLLFDKMVIGTAGSVSKWLVDKVFPESWSYDENGNVSIFGNKYKIDEDWEVGKRFTEWRRTTGKKWWTYLEKFILEGGILNPEIYKEGGIAKELFEFVSGVLGIFYDWIMNRIKNLVPKWLWPEQRETLPTFGDESEAHGGKTREEVEAQFKKDNPEGYARWKMSTKEPAKEGSGGFLGGLWDFMTGDTGGSKTQIHKETQKGLGMSWATDPGKQPPGLWSQVAIDDDIFDKNMAGTKWEQLGGWDKITDGILDVWNSFGFTDPPVFTSGKRTVKQNKLVSGVENSQHLVGTAFDLRNKYIPIKDRGSVYTSLLEQFGGSVSSTKSQRHAELDGKKGQHFHFAKAAEGFFGLVTDPTLFLTGESGPENVIIQPRKNPSNQMLAMRNMGADVSFGGGFGGGGGGGMAVVDSSTSVHNATVLAIGNGPLAPAIDDGLNI